ncbi:hypothetical protein roselon_03626 [Roseibacterium elongatum DSM 19469]|uniref:SnoaL-like domain-containing protein n=1 Tax=Roseicyclus elongatus DSM 19469 TaxID=1294273 RepID=W8STL5_9RHOB|nr:hypothetical protein [Roseibacterium elongatum]AHM05870.1 hypothetical protein roselon_03626 [Roseibacterium elongatum DSM 19469]
MGGLLWTGAFEAVAEIMHYPQRVETRDGGVHYAAPHQMREAASEFRAFLSRMGATSYHRIAKHATFADGDRTRIEGAHTTHILRGGNYAVEPFTSHLTLVLRDGVWLGAGLRSAISNHTCTILPPAHLAAQRQAQAGQSKEG